MEMVRLVKASLMTEVNKDMDNSFTSITITSGSTKITIIMVRGLLSTMMGLEERKDYLRKVNLFEAPEQTNMGPSLRLETLSPSNPNQ